MALNEILIAVNNTKEDIRIFEPVFMLGRFCNATIKTVVFSEENADAVKLMAHSEVAVEMQNKLEKNSTKIKLRQFIFREMTSINPYLNTFKKNRWIF